MIPSHTKVAWAFLDKLLGRTPPVPATDSMSMEERNQVLDDAIYQMGARIEQALEQVAQEFAKQVHVNAAAYNLDPRVVFRQLFQPRGRWPQLPHTIRRWLDVMVSASALFEKSPVGTHRVPVPDDLQDRLRYVFMELGWWASTDLKKQLEQIYLRVLQREARNVLPVYTYPGEPAPPLPKVTLALMHEFEWRLSHARIPLGSANVMERVFGLFT